MPRRGRKPKPTTLKLLAGNPGKRPLNAREPRPPVEAPACPPHLDEEAQAEWQRMVAELIPLGVLTRIDRAALAAYCQAWSRWVRAEQELAKYGAVLASRDKKWVGVSPYLTVCQAALKTMQHFLAEFGLTPSSRSRVQVGAPADPTRGALADFAQGRKR